MKRLPFLLICLLAFARAPAGAAGWASEGLTNVAAVVAAGCQVSIAGICVIDIESWRPNAIFPRI